MIRRAAPFLLTALAVLGFAVPAFAAEPANCEAEPRPECFGIASAEASLSTRQAGAHPDFELEVAMKEDPSSPLNVFGLHDSYAPTRNIRFDLPPGLIGDPNAIGSVQQCSVVQLLTFLDSGGCPNGSQVGISTISGFHLNAKIPEPVYMMQSPGGEVVARIGLIAGAFPTFIDFRVRSESDYGVTGEVVNASTGASLVKLESTLWGVPADPVHDTERCTLADALFSECVVSPPRPPGGREAPFLTNPTRCGVELAIGVNAFSWFESEMDPEGEVEAGLGEITGCDSLPFGPSLEAQTTSRHTTAPSGLGMTIRLPASTGVKVLEPSQIRYMRIDLPPGLAVNPAAADGLAVCSPSEVHFGESVAANCPDGAKLAATEFDIPVLERNVRGAIYLREPEPGRPYRIWIVADDLGLHVKLPGELELDEATGQIHSVVVGTPETEGIPQAPLREVKLLFKSGFRAPLVTPDRCGAYKARYEFVPWSGGPPAQGDATIEIDEGCGEPGFAPKISAGSANAKGGAYSPFDLQITRQDGEENLAGATISLPTGLAASFRGIPHCEGAAAITGACPPDSRIGKAIVAVGPGPTPLWVPQPGKRPTAIYLGGPYKGAPTSIVAVVPKQAGPFDFGDEVVRSAVEVDPVSARATTVTDPFPQILEGIPISYRTIDVQLDRPGFALNPTSCAQKETVANLISAAGQSAAAASSYAAVDCAGLGFTPRLGLKLRGGTGRGAFPALRLVYRPRAGDANLKRLALRFPPSEFIAQGHFRTICTRVQFAAAAGFGAECPPGSVYGRVKVWTPLLDEPLTGKVYLRSSNHNLPDAVLALQGPPSLPIQLEVPSRIDSVRGGLRVISPSAPDAPITEVVVEMQGGQKGLFENSQDLCKAKHRARAGLVAHSGRAKTLHPTVRATGCKGAEGSRRARLSRASAVG